MIAELQDWQEDATAPPLGYEVTSQGDRIDVNFDDGRSIWIENQDGKVRVHLYDAEHDEPLSATLTTEGKSFDASDA